MVHPLQPLIPAPRLRHGLLALAAAIALATGGPLQAQEIELRWVVPAGEIYPGQTFELTLEVTATATDEGGFVQLFPQPLGLPLQLEALQPLESMAPLELLPREEGGGCSLVLDGEIVRAEDEDPDPRVTRLRLTRFARARRPGPIRLPEATGRYAVSSAFREDLVRGSVPVERVERSVRGPSVSLAVRPLPEEDQPIDFEGAVGPLTMEVSIEPNRARVGETLQLQVAVLGGSLNEGRAEPRLAAVDGLRLVGTRSERTRAERQFGRVFRYDLEATSTAPTATPAVTLVTFDPEAHPPGYRTLSAGPLPVSIRPGSDASTPAPDQMPEEREGPPDPPEKPRLVWTPAVMVFIVVLAAISTRRRRRSGRGGVSQ